MLLRIRSHPRDALAPSEPWGSDLIMFVTVRQASVRRRHGWLRALLPPRRWKSRWCVFPAGRSSCFPYGSGEEAGGEESSIPSDDLGTLATGGCYVAERGSEHLGLRQRPPLRCRVSYRDVTGRTRWLRSSPLIARPSPNLSLDRNPESPRLSARRHWRCTSIAAGPTSASSKSTA